jgi:hypothetical protein
MFTPDSYQKYKMGDISKKNIQKNVYSRVGGDVPFCVGDLVHSWVGGYFTPV